MEVTAGGSYGKSIAARMEMKEGLFLHRVYPLGVALPIGLGIEGTSVVFTHQANPSLSVADEAVVSTQYALDPLLIKLLV